MQQKLVWTLVLVVQFVIGWSQSNAVQTSTEILSKPNLSIQDFKILDSLIFGINYYNSDIPLKLYQQARNRAKEQELPEFYLHFDILLADLFYENDQTDSCEYYIQRAMKESLALGEERIYARTANLRRLLATGRNSFEEAYRICFEALEIFEKLEDLSGMGVANRDIGSIMLLEEKYDDALKYCLKSAEYLVKAQNWYELTFTFQRVGITYRNLGDFKSAHEYVMKSMDACRKLHGFRIAQGLSKKFWTQGYVYAKEEKFDAAIASFDSCRYYGNLVGYLKVERSINNSLGSIYLQTGEYQKALASFQKSLQVTKDHNLVQLGYDHYVPIYSNLVASYEGLGDFENAYFYLKKIDLEKDSIFKLSSEKQIAELQTKYETTQKENAISQLKRDKNRQQILLVVGSFLLASFIFLAYLLWKNVKYKNIANEILSSQKQIIETKNKQNELLLREIHHRVKNNLQTISSLLSLQSETITDKTAFDAVEESKNRVRSMALIHQKLYQGENLASIEMKNYFTTMGSAIIESFGEQGKNIKLNVEMKEMDLDVDAAIPIGLIANELLTNSLKYAFVKNEGEITIKLRRVNDETSEMSIADNGTFINPERKEEEEAGFGTFLIQLLSAQLRGKMTITKEGGTKAVLQFPSKVKSAV